MLLSTKIFIRKGSNATVARKWKVVTIPDGDYSHTDLLALKYLSICVRSSQWCVYTVHVNMTRLMKATTHCVTNARKKESYLISRERESSLLGLDLNSFLQLFLSSLGLHLNSFMLLILSSMYFIL